MNGGHRATQRRLAAIMFADVVGYSRMVAEDEAGTLARVRLLRHHVIVPRIAAHAGRLFASLGDGFVAEFASAVEAVSCAVKIQRELAVTPADAAIVVPFWRGLVLRIGINLGDVSVEADGGLCGGGTNIAARLQALAEPGGILISADVHRQLAGRTSLAFEDRGDRVLKNIPLSVRTYELPAGAIAALPRPEPLPSMRSRLLVFTSRRAVAMGGTGLAASLAAGAWWMTRAPRSGPMITPEPPSATKLVEQTFEIVESPRILCACSEPYADAFYRFDRDIAVIEKAFPGRSYVRRDLTSRMLREILTEQHFDVVHLALAVDRERGDLVFDTVDRFGHPVNSNADRMRPEAFANLLAAARARLVVVASCHSLLLAVEIAHVANAITSEAEISGDHAAGWEEVFYDLLSKGHALYSAFQIARDANVTPMRLIRFRDVAFAADAKRLRASRS